MRVRCIGRQSEKVVARRHLVKPADFTLCVEFLFCFRITIDVFIVT